MRSAGLRLHSNSRKDVRRKGRKAVRPDIDAACSAEGRTSSTTNPSIKFISLTMQFFQPDALARPQRPPGCRDALGAPLREPGLVELVVGLEPDPELRTRSQCIRQPEGGGPCDPFPAANDLVDCLKRPVHEPRETGLGEPPCLQLLRENIARRNRNVGPGAFSRPSVSPPPPPPRARPPSPLALHRAPPRGTRRRLSSAAGRGCRRCSRHPRRSERC